jgi:LAO/AO transport system kinase
MADLILINKAEGENRARAELACADQNTALHYIQAATPGWKTLTALCSGLTGEGVPEAWQQIERFYQELEPKGVIARRRQQQALDWLTDLIQDELRRSFYQDSRVAQQLAPVQGALLRGEMTAVQAARKLLAAHRAAGAG